MPDEAKYIVHDFEPVIGLEVHAQLTTASKIFCGCKNEYGLPPNTLTCPVCLGLPGALPVLNKQAVEYAMKMILAVEGEVNLRSIFARKNYFYPDLPKGYQISQYDHPIGERGSVKVRYGNGESKVIRIKRIHLEEDAGKSLHPERGGYYTRVDLNRCGVPLIEIVTEPDITSPAEAREYLIKLKQILRYLNICSGDMEKGHLRCDANVSVRPLGSSELGTKTEVKNMNSFRWVEKALAFEIERQVGVIKSGGSIEQVTMLWDEKKQASEPMRTKEESHDYRYFPEPDLVNLVVDETWLKEVKNGLPELPDKRAKRFVNQYGIPEYDAGVLTESRELADYYEEVMNSFDNGKAASNWIMVELLKVINEEGAAIESFRIGPPMIAELLNSVKEGVISGKMAKEVFEEMVQTGRRPNEIIKSRGLVQVTDESVLKEIIAKIIRENPDNLKKYRSGKSQIFGYFVGQVMKETGGKANPGLVNRLLKEKLDEFAG
ncbi:Aspartyl/glutamyl-tRNA(Asn/Gln) amidotransferase subunit B [Candidatus Zixiibacteriota bacterium]|nr:Aspartyl/glutamyl-tRNA(Asn/Gln) amidotransferase subunit B [candidate division Zixibacteria bacterium]